MKLIVKILFLWFLVSQQSFGQNPDSLFKQHNNEDWIKVEYRAVKDFGDSISQFLLEEMTNPIDKYDSLCKYFLHNISYPESAFKDTVKRNVLLKFTVDDKGRIGDVEPLNGFRHDLDSVCFQIAKQFPKWHPFRQPKIDNINNIKNKTLIPIKK